MYAIRLILGFVVLLSASLGAYADHKPALPAPQYPDINSLESDNQDALKRGEYLVKMGDCYACHTKRGSNKAFSGGDAITTPFGNLYAPNITPSKEHGLGAWSFDDFTNAMKHGVSKDGSHLYPAFPYEYYQHLTQKDLFDMWTYLSALPAVDEPSTPADLMFPFNIRMLQVFWKLMFFYPYEHELPKIPGMTDEQIRGRYLVEGLTHCQMCHTPRNALGGMKRSLMFEGAANTEFVAPKIIGSYLKDHDVTVDDMVRLFKHNDRVFGPGKIQQLPMLEVNEYSLQTLSSDESLGLDADADLKAIAAYILSTKPIHEVEMKTADDGVGAKLYQEGCAACHDMGSAGAPKLGDQAAWAKRKAKGLDMLISNAWGGYNSMPAGGFLKDKSKENVAAAVKYMLAKLEDDNVKSSGMVAAPAPKKLSEADEKALYKENCADCHGDNGLGRPAGSDGQTLSAWQKRFNSKSVLDLYLSVQKLDGICQFAPEDHSTQDIKGAFSQFKRLITGSGSDL